MIPKQYHGKFGFDSASARLSDFHPHTVGRGPDFGRPSFLALRMCAPRFLRRFSLVHHDLRPNFGFVWCRRRGSRIPDLLQIDETDSCRSPRLQPDRLSSDDLVRIAKERMASATHGAPAILRCAILGGTPRSSLDATARPLSTTRTSQVARRDRVLSRPRREKR